MKLESINTLLVTGGCGFIGSHFINYIHEKYPHLVIVNIDRVDYCSSVDNITNKGPTYIHAKIDLNNQNEMRKLFETYMIDAVVHFAAQSHVDNSFGNSLSFTMDNVLGTHVLMECCRQAHLQRPIQKIVHISTDEVYGEVDLDHSGCHEKSLLNPTNPYAATKAAAEFIVRSYYHSFKLPIVITRGNNVFGENQYPEKVIPKFLTQMLNDNPITVQGLGTARRNFIYVDNVSSAVEVILTNGEINEVYNIGCDDEYSVMEIAEILSKKVNGLDKPSLKITYIEDRCFNDQRYCIDSSKLKALGWTCSISFEEGIDRVVKKWKQTI
jgi:dTDP-glucose 4,6-dehydratase